jgi:hypothetical protein
MSWFFKKSDGDYELLLSPYFTTQTNISLNRIVQGANAKYFFIQHTESPEEPAATRSSRLQVRR